jgi:serine/threonine protein phosphatase 1
LAYRWKRFLTRHLIPKNDAMIRPKQCDKQREKEHKAEASKLTLSLARNQLGRDFVIGDIHGCYAAVDHALMMIKFDRQKDRLICVGDLLNRGDENMRALDYITQPWFYSVIGNHDWVHAFDYSRNFARADIRQTHLKWAKPLRQEASYKTLRQALQALPLMLEVDTPKGIVGIVHGEIHPIFDTWQDAKASLDVCAQCLSACRHHPFMVGRSRQKKHNKQQAIKPVKGVRLVISGHTPQKKPIWIGNSLFIDTGLVYGVKGKRQHTAGLTIINLHQDTAYYFPFDRDISSPDANEMRITPLHQLKKKWISYDI